MVVASQLWLILSVCCFAFKFRNGLHDHLGKNPVCSHVYLRKILARGLIFRAKCTCINTLQVKVKPNPSAKHQVKAKSYGGRAHEASKFCVHHNIFMLSMLKFKLQEPDSDTKD
jgi:hypothetical protein